MNQGRSDREMEANNKIMAIFLSAMLIFILLTYALHFFNCKMAWVQKLNDSVVVKNK